MLFSRRFKELLYTLFLGREKVDGDCSIPSLAYMGDVILDLYIRLYLLEKYPEAEVALLHRKSVQYSNSNSQRLVLEKIYRGLPVEERRLVDKARKDLKRVPSPIHLLDFQVSTALESLLGSLFMKKKFERLMELLDTIIQETKNYEEG